MNWPQALRAIILNYYKAIEDVYRTSIPVNEIGEFGKAIVNTVNLVMPAVEVFKSVRRYDVDHCIKTLVLAVANYVNYVGSEEAARRISEVYSKYKNYEGLCELYAWEQLLYGALNEPMQKCPFCNLKYYSEIEGLLGQYDFIPVYIAIELVKAYILAKTISPVWRYYAVFTAYTVVGNSFYGTDPPPHPKSVQDELFDLTLEDFKQLSDTLGKIIEEYGGKEIPLLPGPVDVPVSGFEIDCPDLSDLSNVAGDYLTSIIEAYYKQVLRSWGVKV